MSREQDYTAIILKKQPFGEADEIIIFYTKEQGKIHCLAKSVKKATSKLQQKLQALFLVELRVAGGLKLPKIIGAEPLKVFSKMRENLEAMKMAFYATELVLKFTADEQKNEPLFNLLEEFLEFLNSNSNQEVLELGLAKFKIQILELSGLGINFPNNLEPSQKVLFSMSHGGFVNSIEASGLPISPGSVKIFLQLNNPSFKGLSGMEDGLRMEELQHLLSKFIEYQLERKIKSETFLKQ